MEEARVPADVLAGATVVVDVYPAATEADAASGCAQPATMPLFVRLDGRAVLVIGAGPIAARKIRVLLGVGARVVVVAPAASEDVAAWATAGAIHWLPRAFRADDIVEQRPWLVLAATGDRRVDDEIAAFAEAAHTFVTMASDGPRSSALFAPTIRRRPFTIAVSSDGEFPALTRLVCQVIEAVLPGQAWIERARVLRQTWKNERTPTPDRFADLVREIVGRRPPF